MKNIYLLIFIYLCTIFSIITPLIKIYKNRNNIDNWKKWNKHILFWILGIRMFFIGFIQLLLPINSSNKSSFELANANISLGILGIIQLKYPEWRKATASYGITYLSLKSILHIIRLSTVSKEYTYETLLVFNDILCALLIATFQTLEGW